MRQEKFVSSERNLVDERVLSPKGKSTQNIAKSRGSAPFVWRSGEKKAASVAGALAGRHGRKSAQNGEDREIK